MEKHGRNKGKKYIKLRGGEIATPENEARAQKFMRWYGYNVEYIRERLIFDHLYDDEVATDTMLYLYECIALKGLAIDKYKWYYLRAYHTNLLAAKKKRGESLKGIVYIDDEKVHAQLLAPDFDYAAYESAVDLLKGEILEYVRATYDPVAVSLFEIYVSLQPEMSYKKLAAMLGYPLQKIWPVIGAIRKDLALRYAEKRYFLLSII